MSLKFEAYDLSSADGVIQATKSSNPMVRKKALKELCPCHVKKDVDEIWSRIFEMVTDPDARVRDQVVHSLCDGSPKWRETEVIEALESLRNDKDERVRKRVRKALASYQFGGTWNIF
jgi:vesicle coat complex subunit